MLVHLPFLDEVIEIRVEPPMVDLCFGVVFKLNLVRKATGRVYIGNDVQDVRWMAVRLRILLAALCDGVCTHDSNRYGTNRTGRRGDYELDNR